MKKLLAVMLTFMLCLSLAACGNKLDEQADEVAEKLDGVWGTTWTAPLGQMTFVYEFSSVNGNAGKVDFYYIWDNDVMRHDYGTFDVSIQKDGVINIGYLTTTDANGNTERLKKVKEETLVYTYEDGNLTLSGNGEDSKSYFKIED